MISIFDKRDEKYVNARHIIQDYFMKNLNFNDFRIFNLNLTQQDEDQYFFICDECQNFYNKIFIRSFFGNIDEDLKIKIDYLIFDELLSFMMKMEEALECDRKKKEGLYYVKCLKCNNQYSFLIAKKGLNKEKQISIFDYPFKIFDFKSFFKSK